MSGQEATTEKLTIESCPTQLAPLRAWVKRRTKAIGFREEDIDRIALAIDEALANVIRHGYEGSDCGRIDIEMSWPVSETEPGLTITIRDYGRQVDPDGIVGRDLDEVRPGGLGVHIMRSVMDSVHYERAEQEGMRLIMTKFLTPSA